MGLINISDLEDGTSADANDINSRFATVLGLVNGNLDSANIEAGGISTANLANGAVTSAKLSSDEGEIGGAFQSWTPTFTNLSGGTLNYAVYLQVGKIVHFKWKYTLAGAGVSGLPTFTVPVTMASRSAATTDTFQVHVNIRNADGIVYLGGAAWVNSSSLSLYVFSPGTTGSGVFISFSSVSSTKPIQWASGDYIQVSGWYEAA